MIAAVHDSYPQTRHMLCIYRLLENVKKKARSKLRGNMVKCFVSDFYNMQNSCSQEQFEVRYHNMLIKYDSCRSYLERLYNRHASWARYSVAKVFTAGIESTQHVESIIGVIKKHVDRGTLLKELVTVIEQELEKEAQYTRITDYYGSNPSVGLMSTYNTIFKEVDSILKDNLAPIPLSLQRAQMKQALLYQATLITIDQVKEWDINYNDIIERLYDAPQICLAELMTDILFDAIKELWEPRGRPPKRLKSAVKEYSASVNKLDNTNTVLKTCSYCSGKGHNIRSCQKHKSDIGNKENC
ncbi:hypothetical protein C2G38_2140449 [Gigaspora rosea]|uniref:Uncharacterized protein n=1 Tax=Gigaspora rosea TaxID=44941 RepID=A0A397VS03_9GLOM|nr:hypothetical protein C2G38_2140449 [Gigaspora rosea]